LNRPGPAFGVRSARSSDAAFLTSPGCGEVGCGVGGISWIGTMVTVVALMKALNVARLGGALFPDVSIRAAPFSLRL
jgi:hypothetical protein